MSEENKINKAMLGMHQELRRINREVIHELVPELGMQKLSPFFNLVAKARGLYIQKLLAVTDATNGMPSDEQVRELSLLRRSYEELLHGGQMIETAIERGYIDVESK